MAIIGSSEHCALIKILLKCLRLVTGGISIFFLLCEFVASIYLYSGNLPAGVMDKCVMYTSGHGNVTLTQVRRLSYIVRQKYMLMRQGKKEPPLMVRQHPGADFVL